MYPKGQTSLIFKWKKPQRD